jgi:hypothetical protein
VDPVERTSRLERSTAPGPPYAGRRVTTSRLIAQTKVASSRAIAVAATVGFLPQRSSVRKRLHRRVCAFHAISRTLLGSTVGRKN